jgi:alkyl hydroperoxide reductase subunit AhpC
MEKQECVSLALLSSYKLFNAKVNIAKVLRSSNKVLVFFPLDFKEICSFSTDFN